jgi:hypothetical protein
MDLCVTRTWALTKKVATATKKDVQPAEGTTQARRGTVRLPVVQERYSLKDIYTRYKGCVHARQLTGLYGRAGFVGKRSYSERCIKDIHSA